MNKSILLRRVALLFSSLVLLGLAACATQKPPTPVTHRTHTITIKYDAAAKKWDYEIVPKENNPKKARVKRNDTVEWKCAQGTWTVYFKGPTPLVDPLTREALPFVSGVAGNVAVGGKVSPHAQIGDEFDYGVKLVVTGTTDPVYDDPRIIIEQ